MIEASGRSVIVGCLVAMLSGAGVPAYGEDTALQTPTWSGLRQHAGLPALDQTLTTDPNRNVFRQAPALTGRFELNDQTFYPFIGAGFGGGYTNDRDRALGSSGSLFGPGQSGDLGKNMMPNEFNLGLRIPF